MPKSIYLDYAAATPVDSKVMAAMTPYFSQQFYNPSAQYLSAKKVATDIEAARAKIANWLGTRSSEIVFTAGGTEANNLAIHGIMQRFPEANLLVSAIEHEAVLQPAKDYDHRSIPVSKEGLIDIQSFTKQIDNKTVLVSVMYANNEIGSIQPIKQVAKIIRSIVLDRKKSGNNLPLYFHVDACQATNYLDLHTKQFGVDLMTINGGKIYGPKQSGALFVRAGIELRPQIQGGGQEYGRRSGTENVAAIIGFSKALDLAQTMRDREAKRLSNLRDLFIELTLENLPEAWLNGPTKYRLPNNMHVTIPGQDNESLMMKLDEQGIECAVGSACSASSDQPSHVLKAIGLSDKEARASLRFSLGRQTNEADVRRTVKTLAASCRLD